MAVKKSRKPPSFAIYSYLKLKGWKIGCHWSKKVYVRGIFSVQNSIQKDKGLGQSGPRLRVDNRQQLLATGNILFGVLFQLV